MNVAVLPSQQVAAGALVTLSATVVQDPDEASAGVPPVPTGQVTFTLDGTTLVTETLDAAGESFTTVPEDSPLLRAGDHVVRVSYTGDGVFAASEASLTLAAYFPDYPPTARDGSATPFFGDISWLVGQGITTGYADGTFGSVRNVSRQAMAAFLFRAANPGQTAPPCARAPFRDVPASAPFCAEITWLAAQGITAGYADGGFHPAAPVSRQAMAAFLHRFSGEERAGGCTGSPFNDVPTGHQFCPEVTWLATTGVTTGYADGGFHPAAPVTRQAMAAFLHRLIGDTVGAPAEGTVVVSDEVAVPVSGDPNGAQTAVLPAGAEVPAVGGSLVVPPSDQAPDGLLGRVTAVAPNGDGTATVTTAPATLDEVYDELVIVSEVDLQDPEVIDPNSGQQADGPGPAASRNGSFAADLGKFTCSGSAQAAVDVGFDMSDFRVRTRLDLAALEVSLTTTWTPKLAASLELSGAVTCELKADAFRRLQFPVSVSPPITMSFVPVLTISAEGGVQLSASLGVELSAGFVASPDGVDRTASASPVAEADFTVAASGSAFAGIDTTIALAGRAGVSGLLGPRLTLGYTSETGCLSLDASLEGDLRLTLDVWFRAYELMLVEGTLASKSDIFKRCTGDDRDGDGHPDGTDCDPDDPDVNPGGTEVPNDGVDQDCDGADLEVRSGTIQVALRWDNDNDQDLHVWEPNGSHIWYSSRGPTSTGGYLDRDDNVGTCGVDGTPGGVENVVWPAGSRPARGTYTVEVREFRSCGTPAAWTAEVFLGGQLIDRQSGMGGGSLDFSY
ncbi:S-layer homology domain-containing protein [Geodermatophilus sp. URMC 60]